MRNNEYCLCGLTKVLPSMLASQNGIKIIKFKSMRAAAVVKLGKICSVEWRGIKMLTSELEIYRDHLGIVISEARTRKK